MLRHGRYDPAQEQVARQRLEESLDLARAASDRSREATVLNSLGVLAESVRQLVVAFRPVRRVGDEIGRVGLMAVTDALYRTHPFIPDRNEYVGLEQVGDVRCNRTAHGLNVGDRYATLLDEDDPRDAQALADFVAAAFAQLRQARFDLLALAFAIFKLQGHFKAQVTVFKRIAKVKVKGL